MLWSVEFGGMTVIEAYEGERLNAKFRGAGVPEQSGHLQGEMKGVLRVNTDLGRNKYN